MAFDTALRDRIHDALADQAGITGKPLFGGYGVFRRGVMFAGVWRTSLIVKLRDGTDDALREPHTSGFQPPGGTKPMTGWVVVDPPGIATDAELREWLDRALAVIPKKAKKPAVKKKPRR
jgi:TfoX/Sxy family transcriptional regulator of competence genes